MTHGRNAARLALGRRIDVGRRRADGSPIPHQETTKIITRAITLGFAAALLLAAPLRGAEFRSDETLTIAADERIEGDLYAFGVKVVVDGEVAGDLVAFGNEIWINGSVEGDVIAGGQTIVLAGSVGDDARIGGQVLKIDDSGKVIGDVIAGGFSFEAAPGSAVDGDVVYGGFQALLAGSVGGDVRGALANCKLIGETIGDVWLEVGGDPGEPTPPNFGPPPPVAFPDVPGGLTVAETAHVGGTLFYTSQHEADVAAGAMIDGDIQFEQQHAAVPREPTPTEKALVHVRRYGALLFVGLAAVLVAPGLTSRLGENARRRLLPCLGWGMVAIAAVIVAVLVGCIAAVLLAILAGAAGLGELTAFIIVGGLVSMLAAVVGIWLVNSYLAQVIVALAAGGLMIRGPSRLAQGLALVLGLAIVVALTSAPYVAGIAALVIVFIGFGALWISCRDKVRAGAGVEANKPVPGTEKAPAAAAG